MSCRSTKNIQIHNFEYINIGDNSLIEYVVCNKPSSEGYDVKNLISNVFVEKNKGFLVERFISPPVVLTFEFKSAIYMQYIAIYCKVGAQKTTGLEICIQSKVDSDYVSVGSGVLNESKSGFVFHRFNETVNKKFGDQYLLRTFKPKSCPHLSSVKRLKITIFRTSGTSVPALGKVEFWGIVRNIENFNKKILCNLDKTIVGQQSVGANEVSKPTHAKPGKDFREPSNLSTKIYHQPSICLPIPEDFIDPITCEVMSLPVVMPSGKIIDNTTLESYVNAERFWGRGPNDPFTGVMFTDSSKPVGATNLKARIDQYLSLNSNCTELFNIPRTVGRLTSSMPSQITNKAFISKLIKHSTSKCDADCGSTTFNNQEDDIKSKRRKLVSTSAETLTDIDRNSTVSNSKPVICDISQNINRYSSFQERMEKSLELALKSTLSQLPNLTGEKPQTIDSPIKCSVCNYRKNLFHIPCKHYICRSCLISGGHKSEMICLSCNFNYTRSDLNKIHTL